MTPSARAAPGDSWELLPHFPETGAIAIAVTDSGEGWVAVGAGCAADPPGCERSVPAAWSSADGRAWTRTPSLPGADFGETDLVLVASNGAVLYAAGNTYEVKSAPVRTTVNAAVWRSTDGLTWESVGSGSLFDLGVCIGGCPGLQAMAAGPAGVVISGWGLRGTSDADAEDFAVLWFSPDGNTWERLDGAPTGVDAMGVSDLVASGPGFVAVGVVQDHAVTWSSANGLDWTGPHDLPTPRDLAEGENLVASLIAARGERLVVLGARSGAEHMVVWSSADGVAWSEGAIEGVPFQMYGRMYPGMLTETGGLFLVLGSVERQLVAWTSRDGVTWERRISQGLPAFGELGYGFADLAGGPLGAILVADPDAPFSRAWISPGP